MSYLDTSRGRCAGHLRQDVHHRRAGAGIRHGRQRDLRPDLLAVDAGVVSPAGAPGNSLPALRFWRFVLFFLLKTGALRAILQWKKEKD